MRDDDNDNDARVVAMHSTHTHAPLLHKRRFRAVSPFVPAFAHACVSARARAIHPLCLECIRARARRALSTACQDVRKTLEKHVCVCSCACIMCFARLTTKLDLCVCRSLCLCLCLCTMPPCPNDGNRTGRAWLDGFVVPSVKLFATGSSTHASNKV